ncbi:MAG: OB-fold domain-containing protein [Deltaproteobacteria bacterium]|nr:OB-fold domain-containing protein [Deltaproteobacteria bacterium]MCL5276856.1 OB-fold domain-containing protein [Deltaproteobacteria bacterium]
MVGIVSYGGYIPRRRLNRMAIMQEMGWYIPALMMVANGERSMCNWDEDSLTMAVASARDCISGFDKSTIDGLFLATTTPSFSDRQNAGIVSAALNLRDDIATADVTSSLKSATTALIAALESLKGGDRRTVLVAAADHRKTRSASFYEMWFGDGAASLLLGRENVIAEYKGSYSLSVDFVDHYRGQGKAFDYTWEERWIRDEGYAKIIPQSINGLLKKYGLGIKDVSKVVYPCFISREHKGIAKKIGASKEQVIDNMHEVTGETGAAHPLVLLVSVLEQAKPGDRIVVASFGQGSDALLFEVTGNIARLSARKGIKGSLENRKEETSYAKFLKFNELIEAETGIRAEAATQTALTSLWRNRRMILGLVGGKCKKCGTVQYPKTDVCVNPKCNAFHAQEDCEFSGREAKVMSFTGDYLAVSVEPPAIYGMVQFDGGGRTLLDFTDCDLEGIQIGQAMQLSFRKKYYDKERGFAGYFWKAIPK